MAHRGATKRAARELIAESEKVRPTLVAKDQYISTGAVVNAEKTGLKILDILDRRGALSMACDGRDSC